MYIHKPYENNVIDWFEGKFNTEREELVRQRPVAVKERPYLTHKNKIEKLE